MSLTPEEAIAIVIKEKELNKAVLAAKTSLKADEGDAKLQKKYDSAKAKYKAVYAEAVTARKLLKAIKAAAPPEPKTSKSDNIDRWTCELCDVTIKVNDNGHNREVHETGKKHLEKVADAAGKPKPKRGKKTEPGGEHLAWSCEFCHVTIATAARKTHESGARHKRMQVLGKKFREAFAETSKPGDWLCKCGQHNYASKDNCVREKCQLSKDKGDTMVPATPIPKEAEAEKSGNSTKKSFKDSEKAPLDPASRPASSKKAKTSSENGDPSPKKRKPAESLWLADDVGGAEAEEKPKKERDSSKKKTKKNKE